MNSPSADSSGSNILDIRQLGFHRDGRQILSRICLEVKAGDFLVITGPNGGGKTTLLRIILGLERPDSGFIRVAPGATFGYLPQKSSISQSRSQKSSSQPSLPQKKTGPADAKCAPKSLPRSSSPTSQTGR